MTDRPATPDRSGAESLVQTFVDAGVRVCFTNPGTSEMHFVAALDSNPQMRRCACVNHKTSCADMLLYKR